MNIDPMKYLQFTVKSTISSDIKMHGIAMSVAAGHEVEGFLNLVVNGSVV